MFFNLLLTLLGPFFSNLGDLPQSHACLLPEIPKKVMKNTLYVGILDM